MKTKSLKRKRFIVKGRIFVFCNVKGKGKVTSQDLSTLRPLGPIVFLPQQVPAFIARGGTHHTDVRTSTSEVGNYY
jgi:hypothetical protein